MSGHQLIGFFAFVLVCGFVGVYSTILHYEMVELVNAMLPAEKQFPLLGYSSKLRRLVVEYRRLYPSGTLDKRLCFLSGIMFGAVAVMAWAMGFPPAMVLVFGIGLGCARGFITAVSISNWETGRPLHLTTLLAELK